LRARQHSLDDQIDIAVHGMDLLDFLQFKEFIHEFNLFFGLNVH